MLLPHTAYYFLARGLPGIINFLAITVYTRLLVPDDYGQYALALASVGLLNSVFFQWMQHGLARFLPRHSDRPDVLLATLLTAFLIVVALTAGIGGIASWYAPTGTWRTFIALVMALTWAQAWFDLNLQLVASRLEPHRYGFLSVAKATLALGLGTLLVVFGLKAHGPLLGLLVGILGATLMLAWRAWRGARIALADAGLFRDLWKYGLPLSIMSLLAFVVSSSDRFLLAWIMDKNAAGLYSAGYDLAQYTLGTLMVIVNLAAYPLVVRTLEQSGNDAVQAQLSRYGLLLFAMALPATLGFIVLAGNIAHVVLGTAFSLSAAQLLPWFAIAALIGGLKALYYDLAFQLARRTQWQLWIVLAAAVINLLLNLLWIPIFGLLGAAYTTVLAYIVGLILSAWLGRRIFPLPALSTEFVKVAAAALMMAVALWILRGFHGMGMLVVQLLVGMAVYVVGLMLLNVADSQRRVVLTLRRLSKSI